MTITYIRLNMSVKFFLAYNKWSPVNVMVLFGEVVSYMYKSVTPVCFFMKVFISLYKIVPSVDTEVNKYQIICFKKYFEVHYFSKQ